MVSVDNFRSDPMFPRIERAVAAILASGKVVAPVDVLVKMDVLAPKDCKPVGVPSAECYRA